jgi:hypothetical protein
MRNDPALAVLKHRDLEFAYEDILDDDQYQRQFHLFGDGVVLIDNPKRRPFPRLWWSCQPENKKPKRGTYPWD